MSVLYKVKIKEQDGNLRTYGGSNDENMIIDIFMRYILLKKGEIFEATIFADGVPKVTATGDGQCVIVETETLDFARKMKDFNFNASNN